MNAEFDHDLTADQWEALKALRLPVGKRQNLVPRLRDHPVLTELGRKALIRGSYRLWDFAARESPSCK
jgi:hypothetical protein